MKLHDILKEGLIKLPKNLHGQMTKFFIRMYLAYYQDCIEEDLVGKDYYEAKKLADEVAKEYDIEVTDQDFKKLSKWIKETFVLTPEDVPYRAKLEKLYPNFVEQLKLPIKIKFTLDFGHQQTGNELADFDPNDNTLRMAMPNIKLTNLSTAELRRDAMTKYLQTAIGLIDHEMTHAIQHIVLVQFHKSQISNAFDYAKTKGVKMSSDAYFNSQIEFDPWIKGEIAVFKAIEKFMMTISKQYDRKLSMEFFVGAKGEKKIDYMADKDMEKVLFTAPSAFFLSLKKNDEAKWKKAVKLFYQSV